jgi:hypothetical protein
MKQVKIDAIKHYVDMINWARKKINEGETAYSLFSMGADIGTTPTGRDCSYCQEFGTHYREFGTHDGSENCCGDCPLTRNRMNVLMCCGGRWLDMVASQGIVDFEKNAIDVLEYICVYG